MMEGKRIVRNGFMGVRFSENEIKRLKEKANSEGLHVSTYVRHASLKTLN